MIPTRRSRILPTLERSELLRPAAKRNGSDFFIVLRSAGCAIRINACYACRAPGTAALILLSIPFHYKSFPSKLQFRAQQDQRTVLFTQTGHPLGGPLFCFIHERMLAGPLMRVNLILNGLDVRTGGSSRFL